jgi:hypothetical protein
VNKFLEYLARWLGVFHKKGDPPVVYVSRNGNLMIDRNQLYDSLSYKRQMKALSELEKIMCLTNQHD